MITPLPGNDLPRLLQRHGVPFVLIGGYAVIFHTHVRATEDVDVVWLRSADSERALLDALCEINAGYFSKDIDPATGMERLVPVSPAYVAANHLMMLWTDYGLLDLFDFIPGAPAAPVDALFARSVSDDHGIRYASREDLRQMKLAAGRPKDLIDLDALG